MLLIGHRRGRPPNLRIPCHPLSNLVPNSPNYSQILAPNVIQFDTTDNTINHSLECFHHVLTQAIVINFNVKSKNRQAIDRKLKSKTEKQNFIKYDNSKLCSLSKYICRNTFQRKHCTDHYQEYKLRLKSYVKTQNLCPEQSKSYFQANVQIDIHDVLLYFNDILASFLYKDLRYIQLFRLNNIILNVYTLSSPAHG